LIILLMKVGLRACGFRKFWPVQTGSEVTLDAGEAAAKRFPGKSEE